MARWRARKAGEPARQPEKARMTRTKPEAGGKTHGGRETATGRIEKSEAVLRAALQKLPSPAWH